MRNHDGSFSAAEFETACTNLARFMFFKAAEVARHVGISYEAKPAEECPDNGRQIVAAFEDCRRCVKPFPVFEGGSDSSVYGSAPANHAFRFWYDYLHYAHGCTTGAADELKLAELHRAGVAAKFGDRSLESRIVYAEVAAQVAYYFNTGNFVKNQKGFIYAALQSGAY